MIADYLSITAAYFSYILFLATEVKYVTMDLAPTKSAT